MREVKPDLSRLRSDALATPPLSCRFDMVFSFVPGIQVRRRSCENGQVGQPGCELADAVMSRRCGLMLCGLWGPWRDETCSVTCGAGTFVR